MSPELLSLARDNVWASISAIIAIAALIVTIYTFYAQKTKKRLLVCRKTTIPLISPGADGVEGLIVDFVGRQLGSATIVLIQIQNIGNTPILDNDFSTDLTIEFAAHAAVLSAEVIESDPPDLRVQPMPQGNHVIVPPHLLNAGDKMLLRVLVEAEDGAFTSRARIAGIQSIETAPGTNIAAAIAPLAGIFLLLVGLATMHAELREIFKAENADLSKLVGLVAGVALILIGTAREMAEKLKALLVYFAKRI